MLMVGKTCSELPFLSHEKLLHLVVRNVKDQAQ